MLYTENCKLFCIRRTLKMQEMKYTSGESLTSRSKNRVFSVVITFTPRFIVIKMVKWLIFWMLCWWQQKESHSFDKIFKSIWKILFISLRKFLESLDSVLLLPIHQTLNKDFSLTQQFSQYFYPRYLTNSSSEAY